MNRVFNGLLTVAVATAIIGLAVTQARAERVTFNSGCFSAPCNVGTLTVSGTSLSFGASSFAVDVATSDLARLDFQPSILGSSDLGVTSIGSQTSREGSGALQSVTRSRFVQTSSSMALLSNSMLWSLSGSYPALNATQSAAALTLQPGSARNGSFSVTTANVVNASSVGSTKRGDSTFQANSIQQPEPNIVGAPAVPEPTTMLLFGTGLLGAAAVLRKKLKARRSESK